MDRGDRAHSNPEQEREGAGKVLKRLGHSVVFATPAGREGSVDDHPDITASRRERQFRANGGKRLSKNGGTLERAAQVAKHASTPTTQLYDRR